MQRPSLEHIQALILDVDGVLTNGKIAFNDQGEHFKIFDMHDGLGLRMLLEQGIEVCIISGHASASTEHRMQRLGIQNIYLGSMNKAESLQDFLQKKPHIDVKNCLAIGDDVVDFPLFEACGLAFAPANARRYVKARAQWVSPLEGGYGMVRDVCDALLEDKGCAPWLLTTSQG